MVAPCYFRLAIVLILSAVCTAIDLPDTDIGRVPTGYGKLSDLKRNDAISGRTEAPSVEKKLEDKQLQLAEDDDYSVVVLDDAIPWDLTADTPDVPDVAVPNRTGPTMAPTDAVPALDDDDYVVIILEDDVPWDDVAVAEYLKDEFEAINNANSNSSDYDDDGFEDDTPEVYPTPAPTVAAEVYPTPAPTVAAEVYPTPAPTVAVLSPVSNKPITQNAVTVAPTAIPTVLPSDYPSALPTISPSDVPTASPTLSCHDKESYRSPINGKNFL